jgi:kindlin 2
LSYLRPKRFTLKGYRRCYFVLRELQLTAFRSKEDTSGVGSHAPLFSVNLKGCEVTPCVHISHRKYGVRLAIPSPDGMSDLWIKCDTVSRQFYGWSCCLNLSPNIKKFHNNIEFQSCQLFCLYFPDN